MWADKDNSEKLSTKKVRKHTARHYSRSKIYEFDNEKPSMIDIEVKTAWKSLGKT